MTSAPYGSDNDERGGSLDVTKLYPWEAALGDLAPDGLPWGGTPITGECEWCSGPLPEDWESIWCSEGCRMASRADRMGDLG